MSDTLQDFRGSVIRKVHISPLLIYRTLSLILHCSKYHGTLMPELVKTGLSRLSWVFFLVAFLCVLLPAHLHFKSLEPEPRFLGSCFSHLSLHVVDPVEMPE